MPGPWQRFCDLFLIEILECVQNTHAKCLLHLENFLGLVRSGFWFSSVRSVAYVLVLASEGPRPPIWIPKHPAIQPPNHPLWRPAGENCICVSVDELGEFPGAGIGIGMGWHFREGRVLGAHRGSIGKSRQSQRHWRCCALRSSSSTVFLPCCNVCQRQNFLQKQKLELILF